MGLNVCQNILADTSLNEQHPIPGTAPKLVFTKSTKVYVQIHTCVFMYFIHVHICHFRSIEHVQNDCQISSLRHNKGLYWTAKNSDFALWKFGSGRSILKYRGSLATCTEEHLCRLGKSTHYRKYNHATKKTAKWSFRNMAQLGFSWFKYDTPGNRGLSQFADVKVL